MLQSDFLKGGTTLQSKAGGNAIAANDLLELAANGLLYPVQVSDFAAVANQGTAVVAQTAVSAFSTSGNNSNAVLAASDGSVYAAVANATVNDGIKLAKYLSNGSLFGSVVLDATTTTVSNSPVVIQLANGNIAVLWANTTGTFLNFAIVDQFLNVIVAKTAIDSLDAGLTFSASALTGGGFAVAYSKTNPFLAVYTNAGGVTLAGAALNNAAAFGIATPGLAIAQLSNGNLAIGIATTTAAKLLGYAITTAAGANVVGCTILNAGGAAAGTSVQVSALTGFFAIANARGASSNAYVLNNAGVLQGGAYTDAVNVSANGGQLVNDGAQFWFLYGTATATLMMIASLPVAGANFIASNVAVAAQAAFVAFYDRGYVVMYNAGSTGFFYVIPALTGGNIGAVVSLAGPATVSNPGIRPGGDATAVLINNASVSVYKYANTAIVGVSQQILAAGNSGTALLFSMGPGAYPTNAIAGTVGKAFDHTATNIVANKGVMLSNSAALKGIGLT